MSKHSPARYNLKLNIFEVPRFVNGNHSGKLAIELDVMGATKKEINDQLESLLAYFKTSMPDRGPDGKFLKRAES